jgi:hypothetical protein
MYLTNKYYDNNTEIGNCGGGGGGGGDHDGFSIPYSWQSQKWEQNKQKRWIQQATSNPIQMWTKHIRIACKKPGLKVVVVANLNWKKTITSKKNMIYLQVCN